jgi:hypothetical protein
MTYTSERCDKREYLRSQKVDVRDYAHAQGRVNLLRRSRHFERGYSVAGHFAEVIAERRRNADSALEQLFHEQVERWKNETGHLSSISRMTSHPSYLRIIGLGREGLPLVLKELRERPDHWLVALNAITGEDPAPDGATFRDAVAAWIKWGEAKGYC